MYFYINLKSYDFLEVRVTFSLLNGGSKSFGPDSSNTIRTDWVGCWADMTATQFTGAFFVFAFFKKKKFTEIYFWIQVLQFYTTAAPPAGRGPTARQVGGRDLYVNKNKIFLRIGPWREPAAPLPGGRLPPQI